MQQQTRAVPGLENNRSTPQSPNQLPNHTRQSSMNSNGQLPLNDYNSAYYNKPYDNIVKNPSPNAKQISPSGSQSSLISPVPSPNMIPMGHQSSSPRNQYFPKRPPNGSPSSLSNSSYNNSLGEVSESSRPLSPPVGHKQSFENLHKQSQSQVTGSSYEKLTNLPMHMAGTIGDFQNPRQAPRPPNSSNNNSSSNQFVNTQNNYTIYGNGGGGNGTISSPTSSPIMSQNSLRSPTFDALDHFPAPISNTERDNFLRELQNRDVQITQFKNRETWLKAELSLARQAGYVFEEDHNKVPDGIDTENFMDIGEAGSDRNKIMLAVVKIKQELRRAKATIANQAQIASQKITDAERARTAAIQEAVYFKAKLNALLDASESELARIEIERATDLEKRLKQALLEKESLQNKISQLQQTSNHDKSSRKAAEAREKSATTRAEEAEEAHARALTELATLQSRTTAAESQLRENSARLAEANAELSQYRSNSDNSRNQVDQLQQSLEQHKRTLEKVNIAVLAANERANEAESLWIQARQDIVSLEKEAAGLRAELDIKMRDLDRTHARANEMERLLAKAQKEVDAVRAMMQEGMTELLNTSRLNNEGNNNSSEAAKKIKLLEREIANLKSFNENSQKISQETSNSLADAMIKISQMEGAAMKARSDSAMLQRKLVEASDENAKTKDKLREKEIILTEKTRALEDAEVQVGMMRSVLTEKGILDNDNKAGILSNRFKELELKYDELENEHNQILRKAKDAEERAKILELELDRASSAGSKSTTPDSSRDIEDDLKLAERKAKEVERELNETRQKYHQVQNEHQTAVHYVNSTEKMLRKMKEELTKSKKEVVILNEKLSAAQKRNEELELRLSETENNLSVRKELQNSKLQELTNRKLDEQRSEFIKEKEKLQQRVDSLKSQLERACNEKNMMDAEYEILRKEYETLRKENESLQLIDQELRESLKESEKALRGTQNELDELYSNVSKEFISMKSGPKGSLNNQERKNWEGSRAMLERQIAEYRATNEKLTKENSELEQKWRESENKIALLLDQMEHAVDSYREIEDDIRDSSPRNSNVLSSLTNELDMLRSQWDASNQDTESSDDDEFIDASWSRPPNNSTEKDDKTSRIIAALG
jgi:chromosome segregation ATPase